MSPPAIAPHRIRRTVFELRYPDLDTAFRVRTVLEKSFVRTLAPALERVLDAHAPAGGTHRRIERLEVDLGRIDPAGMEGEGLSGAVVAAVARRLGELGGDDGRVSPDPRDAEELLVGFLESGALPWEATGLGLSGVEARVSALPDARRASLSLRVRGLLARPWVRRRMAEQLGEGLFRDLVSGMISGGSEAALRRAIRAVGRGAGPEGKERVLEALASLPRSPSAERLSEELRGGSEGAGSDPVPLAARDDEPGSGPRREDPLPSPDGAPDDPDADTFYVTHAGVVLLHPFLERFFGKLGLLDESGSLGSKEERQRAVHLLHHLASGALTPEEPETVLLKLLCGHPLRSPLPRDVRLTEDEQAECRVLLAAVVEHWSRLRSTSAEGLRQGFLEREGRVSRTERGWRLVVEQRSIDVLVDGLPWSLGRVHLPWMDAPLWVDWA